jgi:predicted nucleotidyltransferase
MTEITKEFVEEQVEELKQEDDVKAVAVVGSYARKPDSDHNDLDLFIVVEGDYRKRETEELDGIVVEKFYNSREWWTQYLEEDDWWKNYHWYKNADVRYDPDPVFKELEEKAEQVKEEKLDLSENEKKEISYYIWDLQQDIESKDVAQKRFLMNQLFEYLLQKQYYLKDKVPVKENYRLQKLKDFDGYMYKLAQEFLNSSSTMKKERKLEKMVEHVSRNLPEISPEWETEKEER